MDKKAYFSLVIAFLIVVSNLLYAENLKRKNRIAILSLYDQNYKEIGQHGDENKKIYADKHGYDLIIYHELLDSSRPGPWSKILAIQKHLKDYDWIYWSDADSLIMNKDIKLESFIDANYDLIISKDCYEKINTGSFLIKNCAWSHYILKRIYEQKQFINHSLWEQKALQYILDHDPSQLSHLKILDQRTLNANFGYGDSNFWYQDGDFIVHFYGTCNKAQFMKEWSQK